MLEKSAGSIFLQKEKYIDSREKIVFEELSLEEKMRLFLLMILTEELFAAVKRLLKVRLEQPHNPLFHRYHLMG